MIWKAICTSTYVWKACKFLPMHVIRYYIHQTHSVYIYIHIDIIYRRCMCMYIYIYRVSIFAETYYRITSLYNTHHHIYICIYFIHEHYMYKCVYMRHIVYTCLHLFTHPACLAFQEVLDLLLHGVGPEEPPPPVICPIFRCLDHELIHDIHKHTHIYIH